MSAEDDEDRATEVGKGAYRMRLPGFVADEEVGLGDLVSRVAAAAGVRPCGGCAQRAMALNRWMTIAGRRTPPGR